MNGFEPPQSPILPTLTPPGPLDWLANVALTAALVWLVWRIVQPKAPPPRRESEA